MKVSDIVDGIVEKKKDLGLTVQQISDASGVPKSTIDSILRKEVQNPTMQNVLDIAEAIGYNLSGKPPAEEGITDPYVKHIISIYEARIQSGVALNNMNRKHDARIIRILCIALVVMAVLFLLVIGGVVWVWHYDFTHLDRGWITAEAAGYFSTGNLLLAVRDWIQNLL